MKRYILLACFAAIALSSCTFGLNPMGYQVKHGDLESSWKYVASFEYQRDKANYWKSPMEFEQDGGGDCEDFATYLMYLLGPESEMYIVRIKGSNILHAVVHYEGKLIEPQLYGMYYDGSSFTVEDIFSYKDTMAYTTKYGYKSIK